MRTGRIKIEVVQQQHAGPVYGLSSAWVPNTFFSASGDRHVAMWNAQTLEQAPFAVKLEQPAYCCAADPSGKWLLVGTSAGQIHVLDVVGGAEVRNLTAHQNGVYHLAFFDHGEKFISCGADGLLTIWAVAEWKPLRVLPLGTQKLRKAIFFSDEKYLAIASQEGKIHVLETELFNEIITIEAHVDGVNSLCFHDQKNVLISGGKDGFIRVWNMRDHGRKLLELPAHYSAVYALALSPDQKKLVSTSRDKSFKLWDMTDFSVLDRVEARDGGHAHSVNDVIWTNADHFVTCSDDRKIILSSVHD